jgi:hypothetical protein
MTSSDSMSCRRRTTSVSWASKVSRGPPATLAALEEAMEPKFLRDIREREEKRGEVIDVEKQPD